MAGGWASQGLLPPNTVEARGGSAGLPARCHFLPSSFPFHIKRCLSLGSAQTFAKERRDLWTVRYFLQIKCCVFMHLISFPTLASSRISTKMVFFQVLLFFFLITLHLK